MRIISGFKDYYDYIAHQSVDNKIVYNRRCEQYIADYPNTGPPTFRLLGRHDPTLAGELQFPEAYYRLDSIHFCGTRHFFLVNNGHVIYNVDEIFELLFARARAEGHPLFEFANRRELIAGYREKPSTLNRTLNAPVVIECLLGTSKRTSYLTNGSLKSLDFVQLYPPEQAFMKIYDFLIPAEIVPDSNPDNMTRYEAKGFDKKVSFRKRR